MMFFSRLPDALFLDYLSIWCDVKEIAKIDSSICNMLERIMFLSLLSSDQFVLSKCINLNSKTLTNWIILRKIKLDRLSFPYDLVDPDNIFSVILRFDLKKITKIRLQTFKKNHCVQMETFADLINKCPCLVNLLVDGLKNSISLSPFLVDSVILKQLTSVQYHDCIYDSESLNYWSKTCINLKYLVLIFSNTSKLIDSDIENLLTSYNKLTSFNTNYPVKFGILKVIVENNRQFTKLDFDSNEVFSLDFVESFMTKMKLLSDFHFIINKRIGKVYFSYDKIQSCMRVRVLGNKVFNLCSDVILFQQYLALFTIPKECQIVFCMNIPVSSTMLKSLATNNIHLSELHIYGCNIPPVIDSLREVFQKCKQLIRFDCLDYHNNLMTGEHLRSLFSRPTTLKIINFTCNLNITLESLHLMVQNSPLLTELYLWNTKSLDLTSLSDYMKNVKSNVKFTVHA
jgi:hypothetical protein